MEVVILAGGLGTRLKSVVSGPKCMAEINGYPFLHYLFSYLESYRPSRVILSLGYKHEEVEEWVNARSFPYPVVFKVETEPLGTGGAIRYALTEATEEEVVILNGDTLFQVDLRQLVDFHRSRKAKASLALKPMHCFDRYGIVRYYPETGEILSFEEKKPCSYGVINGGIYVINRGQLAAFPGKFSMEKDFFEKEVIKGGLFGFVSDTYFIDIGIPEDYRKAQIEFKDGKLPDALS